MIKKILIIILLAVAPVQAQLGKLKAGAHANTKVIQVGFNKNKVVNTSWINKTKWILFTWENRKWKKETASYQIELGIPKVPLSDAFGLTPIAKYSKSDFNWFYREDVELKDIFLLKADYFSYVFRVFALDKQGRIVRKSQIRYVRQKK